LILNSCAKLNLYLAVLNKRKDKYHNLSTLFERIDLSDTIILKSRRDSAIKIICADTQVPKDSSNLCYRSAQLLQQKYKCLKGIEIKILKRIPVGAGLGGGSSNAASTLVGLNKLWGLRLSRAELSRVAKKIGCDVPFFIADSSFAIGSERGDKIRPLPALKKVNLWHVLVVPRVHVSTPLIYGKWDEYSGLTRKSRNVKMNNLAFLKKGLFKVERLLYNSLEEVTTKIYPEVSRVKRELANLGLKAILMSGSGPAVFGIASSRKEAVTVGRQLKKHVSWRVFVARTSKGPL
jgi:4-diphosphocytidyl-2-C-methyl-D-erythritol kinase